MGRIVSAGFRSQAAADRGAQALVQAGFPRQKIAVFYLTPPRDAVDTPPVDMANASPGAEDARGTGPAGAGIGAAIGGAVGALSVPLLGPIGLAGGAGIGAYVGSLYGALGGMKDDPEDGLDEDGQHNVSGPADPADADEARIREGMRVAVEVDGEAADRHARRVFEASDALEVAVGDGSIADSMIVDAPDGRA
ncbi:MAG: hypothetical protein ACK515_10490 [bacterium]|jgi:hypothetical protein|nr:hypothetical protein [Betaproteobacteria bacterium]